MPTPPSLPQTREEYLAAKSAPRTCACCGQSFTPKRDWQKYCSSKCRDGQNNWLRSQAWRNFHAQEQELEKGNGE